MNNSFKRRDQVKSPRQVATKAYTLATKKINTDDRRKRHIYHIRERLLIQNTMISAKSLLNNDGNHASKHPQCKVALVDAYDDIQPPLSSCEAPKHYPPPSPLMPSNTLECVPVSLSYQSNQLHLLTSTSPVTTLPLDSHPSLPVSPRVTHLLQWSLFYLLHCPPFIFWSTLFFFARKGHRSSNSPEKDCLLLSSQIPISAPRANQ